MGVEGGERCMGVDRVTEHCSQAVKIKIILNVLKYIISACLVYFQFVGLYFLVHYSFISPSEAVRTQMLELCHSGVTVLGMLFCLHLYFPPLDNSYSSSFAFCGGTTCHFSSMVQSTHSTFNFHYIISQL